MFKRMMIAIPKRIHVQIILPNLIHFQSKIRNKPLIIRLKTTATTSSIKLNSKIISKKEQSNKKGPGRSSHWTKDELKILEKAVSKHGDDWNLISKKYFQESRTPQALSFKWKHYIKDNPKLLKNSVLKNRDDVKSSALIRWTESELKILQNAVSKHGKDWNLISKKYFQESRTPQALSFKWKHYIKDNPKLLKNSVLKNRDDVKSSALIRWTESELKILQNAVSKHGKDWNLISKKYFQESRTPCSLLSKWSKILKHHRSHHEKNMSKQLDTVKDVDNIKITKKQRKWTKWTKDDDNQLLKLIDINDGDWIKVAEQMNRSKSILYKKYINITEGKRSDDQNLFDIDNWDKNRIKIRLRYKINSKILQQCRSNWKSLINK